MKRPISVSCLMGFTVFHIETFLSFIVKSSDVFVPSVQNAFALFQQNF